MGVFLYFFHMGCQIILPEDIVDFLVIIAWIILSRASHVKGLASTIVTASGDFKTNQYPLPANQRLGAFAAILLILVQLIKFLALLHVTPILKTAAILSMPLTSLWAIVLACYLLPPSTDSSESHFTVRGREVTIASATTFGMLFLFLQLKALPGLIMVMLQTFILIKWIQRKNPELAESALGASHEFGGAIFLLSLQIPFSSYF